MNPKMPFKHAMEKADRVLGLLQRLPQCDRAWVIAELDVEQRDWLNQLAAMPEQASEDRVADTVRSLNALSEANAEQLLDRLGVPWNAMLLAYQPWSWQEHCLKRQASRRDGVLQRGRENAIRLNQVGMHDLICAAAQTASSLDGENCG